VARVEQMLEMMAQPVSLEAPVSDEDDNAALGDLIEDVNAPNPEETVMDSMEGEEVRARLDELPSREREVLLLRYGLGSEEAMTLAEVGARLGITRERARQLEMQALDRLRHPESAAQRKRRGPNKNVNKEAG
jgi:RNA polymerase primary sigma factor